jgi:hypothetical protein
VRTTEIKREAFKRLATKRTIAVMDKLKILGHCANPWQYEYTEEDVRKIFKAIDAELKAVKAKFLDSNKTNSHFHL